MNEKKRTPPPLCIELKNIELATTDERWQVADDLKLARKYNEGKQFIYVFKEMNIEALNVFTSDANAEPFFLIRNTPIRARVCSFPSLFFIAFKFIFFCLNLGKICGLIEIRLFYKNIWITN